MTLSAPTTEVPVFGFTELAVLFEPAKDGPWTFDESWVQPGAANERPSLRLIGHRVEGQGDVLVHAFQPLPITDTGGFDDMGIQPSNSIEFVRAAGDRSVGTAEDRDVLLSLYDGGYAVDTTREHEIPAGVRLRSRVELGYRRVHPWSGEDEPNPFLFDRAQATYRFVVQRLTHEGWIQVSNTLELRTLEGPRGLEAPGELDAFWGCAQLLDTEQVLRLCGSDAYTDHLRVRGLDLAEFAERAGGRSTGLGQFLLMTTLEFRARELSKEITLFRAHERWRTPVVPGARGATFFRGVIQVLALDLNRLDQVTSCQPTRVRVLEEWLDDLRAEFL